MRWLLAFAGALLLGGCEAPLPEGTEAAGDSKATPALWEAKSPQGNRAFLFGTAHALPDNVDWQSPAIDQAFDQAGVLVVEIAELDDPRASIDAFRSRAYSEDLPPLLDRVPAGDRPMLQQFLDSSRTSAEDYSGMDTWAAAMVLAGNTRVGTPENGVDRALIRRGKPVVALESFAEQYALFDDLSDAEQSNLLVAMARETQDGADTSLLKAWMAGDEKTLAEDSTKAMAAFPSLQDKLSTARNRAWITPIVALIDSGRTPFVAVGAAHVVGPEGLVAMLAERGYETRRIQ